MNPFCRLNKCPEYEIIQILQTRSLYDPKIITDLMFNNVPISFIKRSELNKIKLTTQTIYGHPSSKIFEYTNNDTKTLIARLVPLTDDLGFFEEEFFPKIKFHKYELDTPDRLYWGFCEYEKYNKGPGGSPIRMFKIDILLRKNKQFYYFNDKIKMWIEERSDNRKNIIYSGEWYYFKQVLEIAS